MSDSPSGDGCIEDVSFTGEGCAISAAAGSLLTEAVKGKRTNEALVFSNRCTAPWSAAGRSPST